MPYTFTASLAGTHHFEKSYRKFCSGSDHGVRLEFEPQNQFDANAVKVLGGVNELVIGYLDKKSAARIHRLKSKCPTAEAIFDNGECYMLNVTLEVDPPAKKKSLKTGIIEGNTVVGCLVKTKIPDAELREISGELAIIPRDGKYSVCRVDTGDPIGILDSPTTAILERSEAEVVECTVLNFCDGHLFVKITADLPLLSDLEWQRQRIAALFKKKPEYLGCRFGDDPPSERQFSYGLALGIDMRNQTFQGVSKAIDKAKKSGVSAHHGLSDWEEEELYRYLSRSSNQRYAFLEGADDPPRRSKGGLTRTKDPFSAISERPSPPTVRSCEIPTEFKTECPHCGQRYECSSDMNGTTFRCIKCGKEFQLRLNIPKYVRARCPKCKTVSVFPPNSLDKKLECPHCRETFVKNSPGAQACGCLIISAMVLFVLWLCGAFK